jgi:hypothetical protein
VQLLPRSANTSERALVAISGTSYRIAETLEQLAWLAATLRPHMEGQLTVSDIDFVVRQTTIGQSVEPVFYISLYSQDEVYQPSSDAPGQCWTSLFTQSVLAYGFSLYDTNRPKGMLGLEIPFGIMAKFAGVRYPVLFGQRFAFASESSILIPQTISGDSVQWHFQEIKNLTTHDENTEEPDPQQEGLDMERLLKSRAFLGYSKSSEVLLGTAEFADVEISRSQVSRARPSIEFKLDDLVNIGLTKGITAAITIPWRCRRGQSVLVEAKDLNVNERFDRAARTSTLLYDDEKCIAYLVPQMSVVIQMASTHVRKYSSLNGSAIPRADRSADGGTAVRRAIETAQNLEVPMTIESQKYIDIVEGFLDIFEQRRVQIWVDRREYGSFSLKKGLRGWDYTDIQTKEFGFGERELSPAPMNSRPIWWELFKTHECLVLFARFTKSPIRRCDTDAGQIHCRAWEEIASSKHVLLVGMIQLRQLRNKLCQDHAAKNYPGRYMLTDTIAWSRPRRSRLFGESCREGGFCNPWQTMCKVSTTRETCRRVETSLLDQEDEFLMNPGDLEHEGIVLFVDDPATMEVRVCSQHQTQLA